MKNELEQSWKEFEQLRNGVLARMQNRHDEMHKTLQRLNCTHASVCEEPDIISTELDEESRKIDAQLDEINSALDDLLSDL